MMNCFTASQEKKVILRFICLKDICDSVSHRLTTRQ